MISNDEPRVFGVLGDPIKQSLSPLIHNYWYKKLGLEAVSYVPLHLQSDKPVQDIEVMSRLGLTGINVTMPYKDAALQASTTLSAEASTIGAVNTLTRVNDTDNSFTWHGHNTDAAGFEIALRRLYDADLPNEALILGAGGAARAVVYVLARIGIRVHILNRTQSKAEELASTLCASATVSGLDQLATFSNTYKLIVNTVGSGHSGGTIDLGHAPEGGLFFDISYGKAAQNTLEQATIKGWKTEDGLMMLVAQAAEAFKLWFDQMPDIESAYALCRTRVDGAEL